MNSSYPNVIYPKYRPDIDGLRAIAVLSVIVFHTFPRVLKGGFLGVDVFFVISGFLISTIIFENLEHGRFSFTDFYARRIKRIFPSLLLVLISCYLFGWFALFTDEYAQLGKHIASGAGFVSNLVFWAEEGYFNNSAATKPLLHLWSLGIEEQFYIIWPFMLWFCWKRRWNFLVLIVLISIVSFYLNLKNAKHNSIIAFYSPQTRFWELLSGSLLAWLKLYGTQHASMPKITAVFRNYQHYLSNILSFLGLFLLIYGFFQINKELRLPGKWALIPVLGTMLLIAVGPKTWLNRKILSNPAAVWCGLISFPLYLWHWPLLSFARIIESEIPSKSIRLSAIALALVLATVTYFLLEKRIRLAQYNRTKSTILCIIMAFVGGLGYYTYCKHGFSSRKVITQNNLIHAEFGEPMWKYSKNDICQKKYPLDSSKEYLWWFCIANSVKKPTLLLLGNSYANHLFPGIIHHPQLKNHSTLSIGTCDAKWFKESDWVEGEANYPCSGHRSYEQMEFINKIISSEHSLRYALINGIPPKTNSAYAENLIKRIDFLEKNNVKVILFMPHIRIDYDIRGCFARPLSKPKHNCVVTIDAYNEMRANFDILANQIKKSHPSVLFFDQNQLFCKDKKCSFKLNGMPIFRDEYSHFSEYASNQLMVLFADWAATNAPDLLG